MEKLGFDRENIGLSLAGTLPGLPTAFGMSCAQRLYPFLQQFLAKQSIQSYSVFESCLQFAWHASQTGSWDESKLSDLSNLSEQNIPDGDSEWYKEYPYAQDAALALTYALRSLEDERQAVWPAEISYSVVDDYVGSESTSQIRGPLAHQLVQKELLRQRRDLRSIIDITHLPHTRHGVVSAIRQRAVYEAQTIFADER